MAQCDTDQQRCTRCRYWVKQCCHALARLDHAEDEPASCHHYTSHSVPLFRSQEAAPC